MVGNACVHAEVPPCGEASERTFAEWSEVSFQSPNTFHRLKQQFEDCFVRSRSRSCCFSSDTGGSELCDGITLGAQRGEPRNKDQMPITGPSPPHGLSDGAASATWAVPSIQKERVHPFEMRKNEGRGPEKMS